MPIGILRNGTSIYKGLTSASPFPTADLVALYKDMDGFTIPNSLGGDPVVILTPTFLTGASGAITGDKTRNSERLFDGNSHTLYFKFKVITTLAGYIWNLGANATVLRGIDWRVFGTDLSFFASDGSVFIQKAKFLENAPVTLKAAGICEMFCEIDYPNKEVRSKIFGENGDQIGSTATLDITTFTFNDNVNGSHYSWANAGDTTVWNFKKFTGLKTIEQCRNTDYITDAVIYTPDLISGIDISGNGNHFTISGVANKYYSSLNNYMMNYGFTRYEYLTPVSNNTDRYIPHDVSGNEITYTVASWIKREVVDGNITNYNGADGLLYIPDDNFDRSNTTIYSDLARVTSNLNIGHYDVSNPKRWHPYEFNKAILSTWFNTDYNGIVFPHMSDDSVGVRNYFEGIFSYSVNQIDGNYNKILRYTGDYNKVVNTFKLSITVAAGEAVKLAIDSPITSPRVSVLWGDGSYSNTIIYSDGRIQTLTHTYTDAGTYQIEIVNPQSIEEFTIGADAEYDNLIFSASQFPALMPDILKLRLFNTNIASISGDITGCNKLTDLHLTCDNTISYDITNMVDLAFLYTTFTEGVGSGSINGLSKMVYFYPSGACIFTGDPQNMPLVTNFEANAPGLNTITGTLNGLQFLKQICFQGSGVITCDIETLPSVDYLSANQSITFTGSVTGKTALWFIAVPGLTGSIAGLINLRYFEDASYLTIDKPLRANLFTKIDVLKLTNNEYSSEETNQILADLWANKDTAREESSIARIISINGTPTGQGLIDKAALQAYKSPSDTGPKVWTVTTN